MSLWNRYRNEGKFQRLVDSLIAGVESETYTFRDLRAAMQVAEGVIRNKQQPLEGGRDGCN